MESYEKEEQNNEIKKTKEEKVQEGAESKKESTFKPQAKNPKKKISFSNFLQRQSEYLVSKEKSHKKKLDIKFNSELIAPKAKADTTRSSLMTARDLIRSFVLDEKRSDRGKNSLVPAESLTNTKAESTRIPSVTSFIHINRRSGRGRAQANLNPLSVKKAKKVSRAR